MTSLRCGFGGAVVDESLIAVLVLRAREKMKYEFILRRERFGV